MKSTLQLSDNEIKMFEEVFSVMNKYGNNRTFGLQLIHSHFPIEKNEVLYETHSVESRTLTMRPVNILTLQNGPLATAWQQDEKGKIIVASFCCATMPPPPGHVTNIN